MKKKILLVCPIANNKMLYPHLKYVLNILSEEFEVEYFFFRERGYLIKSELLQIKKNPFNLKLLKPIIYTLVDCLKLIKRINKKYKAIIAIDSYPYFFTTMIFRHENVILWSLDFISIDNPDNCYWVNKYIFNKVNKYLKINKKLIIQDTDRLTCFLKSIDSSIKENFLLPVSYPEININATENNVHKKPVVLQIGGINKYYSNSDVILDDFNNNYKHYQLFLHGFFDTEIENKINELICIPICSNIILTAENISKIITACDIGYISYNALNENMYHVSYASGQLVEFLRSGKPIILYGNCSIRVLIEEYQIGVYIDSQDEVQGAINLILSNYSFYSTNAHKLFLLKYNLDIYKKGLLNYLHS